MKHILEADGIQLEFRGRKILSDIYLKCETGKVTGLLGRNGEGKSCLIKIIYGTIICESSIRFDYNTWQSKMKRPELLLCLPQFNFIPKSLSLKRVFQDFGLDYAGFQARFPEFKAAPKSSIGNLSGGERRLIELYIIVRSKTRFALLDEPFTHLNPIQIEKAKELILEEKKNKGLLITDHMFRNVTDISDNLYVLKNGKTYLTNDLDDIETLGYAKL
jgi:ABC-type lipopolysaccharide export system ATPase subunit